MNGAAPCFRWFPATRSSALSRKWDRPSENFAPARPSESAALSIPAGPANRAAKDWNSIVKATSLLPITARRRMAVLPPSAVIRTKSSSTRSTCCTSPVGSLLNVRRRYCAPASRPTRPFDSGVSAEGDRLGVVGLGGLGHMAVKIGAALGAEVTVFSRMGQEKTDAKRLGASGFAVTSDKTTFTRLARRFDAIMDTVSATHDYNAHLELLKTDGTYILVGAPGKPLSVGAFSLLARRRNAVALKSAASRKRRRCSTSAQSIDAWRTSKSFPSNR